MRKLAELREERGLSRADLAAALGVAQSTVAMWELGHRTPGLEMAKRIAKFFGLPVEDILFGRHAHEEKANEQETEAEEPEQTAAMGGAPR